MNVLGLSCSPRRAGNTDVLLDEFLRGVQDHACTVEKIHVPKLNLHPCRHCGACDHTGSCVIKDDMAQIYPKLEQVDALVLASPMFFMAHAAQAKILIDRCQPYWSRKYLLNQPLPVDPPRRAVFIAIGAAHGPSVFAGAKVTMRWFLDALNQEYWANLLFEGLDEKGAISKHPTALTEAYQLATRLACLP